MLPVYRQRRPICIDAGSKFCPCALADTGECLTCSILRGEERCDCDWRGVCILNEYRFNRKRSRGPRPEHAVKVLATRHLTPTVTKLVVEAPDGFDEEWAMPGAFVMARPTGSSQYYSTPLCIFASVAEEPSLIELVVQENGLKTKALLQPQPRILIRGPYYNGWFGYKAVKATANSQVIMVVRGIGQAPALKMAAELSRSGNELLVYLDPGTTEVAFIADELVKMGASVRLVNLLEDKSYEEMEQVLREQPIALLVSAGADIQHSRLSELIKSTGSEAMIVLTNNHAMTCGEGICGACMIEVARGEKIKTCKSQLLGEQITATINTRLYPR